jgi:hypothetical protein
VGGRAERHFAGQALGVAEGHRAAPRRVGAGAELARRRLRALVEGPGWMTSARGREGGGGGVTNRKNRRYYKRAPEKGNEERANDQTSE